MVSTMVGPKATLLGATVQRATRERILVQLAWGRVMPHVGGATGSPLAFSEMDYASIKGCCGRSGACSGRGHERRAAAGRRRPVAKHKRARPIEWGDTIRIDVP